MLLVNLGVDLHLDPAPEPLLAPPADSEWTTLWSSEDPKYGGIGTPPLDSPTENWRIPGHAAVVLKPIQRMTDLVIRMPWPGKDGHASEAGLNCEWLVTNGLGGYASGTLSGVITRRYHGYLVAALPAPFGRVMMLNELGERIELPDGRFVQLSGEERAGDPVKLDAMDYISEFRLEAGTPVWRYEIGGDHDREETGVAARPEHGVHQLFACSPATTAYGWCCGHPFISGRTKLR